jgi:transcriptional regulator with XRE-family HTH domain
MRRSSKPQPSLGATIRGVRDEREATQRAIAKDAGITVAHLCAIERGHTNPTWATVAEVAVALKISLAELAKRAEDSTVSRCES